MNEEMQYVVFSLGNEEYAVEILSVQEIIRPTEITRVPKAPPFVTGVSNLRGSIIPIIDSHQRLSLSESMQKADTNRIIICKIEDTPIGLTVDHVSEVLSLPADNIEIPQVMNHLDKHFIKGIGKVDERLLIILDLKNVLDIGLNIQKE